MTSCHSKRPVTILAACLAALLTGCDRDPVVPSDPDASRGEPGVLHVHTAATGRWVPDESAQIIVDDDPESVHTIELNGTLDISLPPGDHAVELFRGGGERFYPACGVEGGLRRELTVTPGGSAQVDFSILCEVVLELRISTTGSSPDEDGYRLVVGPYFVWDPDMLFPVHAVAPDDTLVFDRDSPQWWEAGWADRHEPSTLVYLWGEAPNCTFSDDIPIRLDPGGGVLIHDIEVECVEPPALEGTIYLSRGDLVALAADGAGETRLTTGWNMGEWSLSPDGTRVFYTDWRDGPYFVGNVGTGETVQLELDVDYLSEPHWGVDGWLYYKGYSDEDGRYEVYRMRPTGTDLQRLTSDGGTQPELSPDGTRLLFNGPSGLTLSDPDGSSPRALGVHPVHNPKWSPDGSLIAGHVLDQELGGDHRLTVFDPATGETTILTSRPYHWWDGFAWSPDGTKLVYPAVQTTDAWWWDWNHDGDLFVVSIDGQNLTRLTTSGDMYRKRLEWRE